MINIQIIGECQLDPLTFIILPIYPCTWIKLAYAIFTSFYLYLSDHFLMHHDQNHRIVYLIKIVGEDVMRKCKKMKYDMIDWNCQTSARRMMDIIFWVSDKTECFQIPGFYVHVLKSQMLIRSMKTRRNKMTWCWTWRRNRDTDNVMNCVLITFKQYFYIIRCSTCRYFKKCRRWSIQ